MENFPSIAYIAWKTFYLLQYLHIKYGKLPIDFSIYCIIALIAWKIQRNSDRILNSGSWIRFYRFCGITTTPIAPNKPIAIGSCAISGTMGVRPILEIWARRRLKPSYPICYGVVSSLMLESLKKVKGRRGDPFSRLFLTYCFRNGPACPKHKIAFTRI